MRSDVKIGIAVGLFVAVVVVVYFVFAGATDEDETGTQVTANETFDRGKHNQTPGEPAGGTDRQAGIEDDTLVGLRRDDDAGSGYGVVIEGDGGAGAGTGPARGAADDAGTADSTSVSVETGDTGASGLAAADAGAGTAEGESTGGVSVGFEDSVATGADSGATELPRGTELARATERRGRTVEPVGRYPSYPRRTEPEEIRISTAEPPARTGQTRRVRIQPGDSFWMLAQEHYGDGRRWKVLAEANPQLNPDVLPLGEWVTIPPLPAEHVAAAGGAGEAGAAARRAGPGEYVVREGDQGFWDVAKNVYGHGKYYAWVAQHNPGVNTCRLQRGQVLKTPALPAERRTAAAPAGGRVAARRATARPGEYVVRAGDTQGFWGIAKALYGDATLHEALAAANPGVDSRKLKVGQTIRLPDVPRRGTGSSGAARVPARSRRTVEESEDPRPYFAEYAQ